MLSLFCLLALNEFLISPFYTITVLSDDGPIKPEKVGVSGFIIVF